MVRPTSAPRNAGFSLVEMLAVIVILGILIAFLVPRLAGSGEVVKERLTKSFLNGELAAAITTYETEFGQPPPGRFLTEWGTEPNDTNVGAEARGLGLWRKERGGRDRDTEPFCNTDADVVRKPIGQAAILGNQLWELSDEWGNPIAYFDRHSYGQKQVYLTIDGTTGESVENTVEAIKDAGGRYVNPRKYQLLSAGIDGRFGTEDDILNVR